MLECTVLHVLYLWDKAVDDFVRIIKYEMSIEGIQVVTAWVLPLPCHEVLTTKHVHTLPLELRRGVITHDYNVTGMYRDL